MEARDYYFIFGVDRCVGADGIKSAYRKLARKYHPDVSQDPDAEDRFKEVQNAYETLKSPERRSAYDQRILPSLERWDTHALPMDYASFYGDLQWMDPWSSWWAWQGAWARGTTCSAAD